MIDGNWRNPFQRKAARNPKLALLRRADTERDTVFSIGGNTKLASSKRPITLARVPMMEKPDEDEAAAP